MGKRLYLQKLQILLGGYIMQPLTVAQDQLLSFVEERILDGQWVFLHSDDVKTLLRSGSISPLDDAFSLFWEETEDKLYLKSISEDWLFCERSYINSLSSHSATTPEALVFLRIKEE